MRKGVNVLTKILGQTLGRVGDLGVAIQQMKNDLGDTGDGLPYDKNFLQIWTRIAMGSRRLLGCRDEALGSW